MRGKGEGLSGSETEIKCGPASGTEDTGGTGYDGAESRPRPPHDHGKEESGTVDGSDHNTNDGVMSETSEVRRRRSRQPNCPAGRNHDAGRRRAPRSLRLGRKDAGAPPNRHGSSLPHPRGVVRIADAEVDSRWLDV